MDKEMTDKQQPPAVPERIWIDPQDSTFWNNTGGVKSLIPYARVQPVDDARVEEVAWEIRQLCGELTPEISGDSTSYAPSTEQIAAIIQRLLPQLSSSEPEIGAGADADNRLRFMEHFWMKVEPHYIKKHGHAPPEQSALWELLQFVVNTLESIPTTGAGEGKHQDLLRDAGAIVCVNDPDAGARVEIRFAELGDAQRLHRALVQKRATAPSGACLACDAPTDDSCCSECTGRYRAVLDMPASAAVAAANEIAELIYLPRGRDSYKSEIASIISRYFSAAEQRYYHCSCGAACTANEYIAHLLQGHDRGLPVVSGSERRCEKCDHNKTCFVRGFCHHSEPGELGVFCGCACVFPTTGAGHADQRDLIVFANWIYSTAREQMINECLEVVTRRRPQVFGNIPESDTAAWVAAKSYLDAEHESIIGALASLRKQGANSEGK